MSQLTGKHVEPDPGEPLAFFTHLMTRHRKPLFRSAGRGIP